MDDPAAQEAAGAPEAATDSEGAGTAGLPEYYGSPEDAAAESDPGPVIVRDGYLVNFVYRYYFPLGADWNWGGEPDADFQELSSVSMPGVTVRVLVSAGNALSLDETMASLRENAASDSSLHVLAESRPRVGLLRTVGDLLAVREKRTISEELTVIRTVTFNKDGNKYYLRLEAPVDSFEKANEAFNGMVEDFKFEFRFPWQKKN